MDRYACPSIDEHFTDVAVYQSWYRVWSTVARVIDHPLPVVLDAAIGNPTRYTALRSWMGRAAELEGRYGHDVAAACEALREALRAYNEDDAARWLHYGLCSSDIVDAGLALRLGGVTSTLAKLALDAADAIEIVGNSQPTLDALYRTHGQPAQVGPWSARWKGLARLVRAANAHLLSPGEIGFDGPTGTGGVLSGTQRKEINDALFPGRYRIRPSWIGWQTADRAGYGAWLGDIAQLVTAAERFALQIRLLASTSEVSEGRGPDYRGSSSMPHKRNPTRSERICGIAPVVRGLVAGYTEAASSIWDAHSLEHSSADRIVIPQVCQLVGFVLTEVADIAETLKVDPIAISMARNLLERDSYAERNQLIRDGVDGDEAWVAAKGRTTGDRVVWSVRRNGTEIGRVYLAEGFSPDIENHECVRVDDAPASPPEPPQETPDSAVASRTEGTLGVVPTPPDDEPS